MCLIRASKERAEEDVTCYKIMFTRRESVDENGNKRADNDFSGCAFYTPFQRQYVPIEVIEGKALFLANEPPKNVDIRQGGYVINGGFIHSYAKLNDALRDASATSINASYYGKPVYACVFECRINKGNDYMAGKVSLRYDDYNKADEELPDGYASRSIIFVKMIKGIRYNFVREPIPGVYP